MDAQLTNAISLQLTQQQLAGYASIGSPATAHLLGEQQRSPSTPSGSSLAGPGLQNRSRLGAVKPDWSGWGDMLAGLPAGAAAAAGGRSAAVETRHLLDRQKGEIAQDLGRCQDQPVAPAPADCSPCCSAWGTLFILAAGLLQPCIAACWARNSSSRSPMNWPRLPGLFSVYLSGDAPGRHRRDHFPHPRDRLQASATACAFLGCPCHPHHAVGQAVGGTLLLSVATAIGPGLTMLLLGLTAYLVLPISRACRIPRARRGMLRP